VTHCGYDRAMSDVIAWEFIGYQPSRFTPLAFEQMAEEPCSRTLIATTLHEKVYSILTLINRTPEILPLPLNGHEHFIDVPRVTQTSMASFEVAGIVRPKPLEQLANGFIDDDDPTFGKQFFDLSETEAEPMVQSDGVTDDLRWKMKTAVAECCGFHHVGLPKPAQLDNTSVTLEKRRNQADALHVS
jgi:hypothetical protein